MAFKAASVAVPTTDGTFDFVLPYPVEGSLLFYDLQDAGGGWYGGQVAPLSIGLAARRMAAQVEAESGGQYINSDSGHAMRGGYVGAGRHNISGADNLLRILTFGRKQFGMQLANANGAASDLFAAHYAGRTLKVYVGSETMPASGADVTVTGLPFAPNDGSAVALMIAAAYTPSGEAGQLAFGCTDGTNQWAATSHVNYLAAGGDGDTVDGLILSTMYYSGGYQFTYAEFSGWTSDGFTLTNFTPPPTDFTFLYMLLYDSDPLAGFHARVLDPTTNGPTSETGFGFEPEGVIGCSMLGLGVGAGGYASFAAVDPVDSYLAMIGYVNDSGAAGDQRYRYAESGGNKLMFNVNQYGNLGGGVGGDPFGVYLDSFDSDGITWSADWAGGAWPFDGQLGILASRTSVPGLPRPQIYRRVT